MDSDLNVPTADFYGNTGLTIEIFKLTQKNFYVFFALAEEISADFA
jgi:hypothetical protein